MFYHHNTDCIEFPLFLKELSKNIKHTYDTNKKDITVNITGDSFELCLDYIIPCGLIANEIIINSYKYAFKNGESGVINIDLKSGNGLRTIIISDDGIGMPLDVDDNKTLGLSLIKGLTEQINGTLNINSDSGKGTTYKIEFVEIRTGRQKYDE
jgi:two-component sensor histidine kinase